MSKLISISHAPNLQKQNIITALKYLCLPWYWSKWRQGDYLEILEKELVKYHKVKYAFTFDSARSSLLVLLKAIGIEEGDEIIIQPLTCIVLPNSIIWAGAKPVYVDVDESFNIDPTKLEDAITEKTRAIIIQHTFGQPAQMDKIVQIARKYNLILIEDCAHSLGAEYKDQKVGTIGDIAFFSFGRDKVISSVLGGAILTNNEQWAKRIEGSREKLKDMPISRIFQSLCHFVLLPIVIKTYNWLSLGKIILFLSQKLKILNKAYTIQEKNNEKPFYIPSKFSNALAHICLEQFKILDQFNRHRKEIAKIYDQRFEGFIKQKINDNSKPIYLRYTILIKDRDEILKKLRRENILLGDWYTDVIMPTGIDLDKFFYKRSSCPQAEKYSKMMINLPTYYKLSKEDAEKISLLIL